MAEQGLPSHCRTQASSTVRVSSCPGRSPSTTRRLRRRLCRRPRPRSMDSPWATPSSVSTAPAPTISIYRARTCCQGLCAGAQQLRLILASSWRGLRHSRRSAPTVLGTRRRDARPRTTSASHVPSGTLHQPAPRRRPRERSLLTLTPVCASTARRPGRSVTQKITIVPAKATVPANAAGSERDEGPQEVGSQGRRHAQDQVPRRRRRNDPPRLPRSPSAVGATRRRHRDRRDRASQHRRACTASSSVPTSRTRRPTRSIAHRHSRGILIPARSATSFSSR